MAVAQFIQDSQSQLTITGLFQLTAEMRSGELAVLFRNNHFSTLYKHTDGHLYCLVTDEGYRGEEGVAWEKLDNEKGDTAYVSSTFEPYSAFKKRQQEEQEEVMRQIRLSEQVSPFHLNICTPPPRTVVTHTHTHTYPQPPKPRSMRLACKHTRNFKKPSGTPVCCAGGC